MDNKKERSKVSEKTMKMIGQNINTALALKDIKQKDLADKLHITDNTVSFWCSGKRTPNSEQIIQIADILGVSTDYLLGFSRAPTSDKDLQFICDYTGLSIETVNKLTHYNKRNISEKNKILNCIFESGFVLRMVNRFYECILENKKYIKAAEKFNSHNTEHNNEDFRATKELIDAKNKCKFPLFLLQDDIQSFYNSITKDYSVELSKDKLAEELSNLLTAYNKLENKITKIKEGEDNEEKES